MTLDLCPGCAHVRIVKGRRGQRYLLCRNPLIPERYPRQPVVACAGYRPVSTGTPSPGTVRPQA